MVAQMKTDKDFNNQESVAHVLEQGMNWPQGEAVYLQQLRAYPIRNPICVTYCINERFTVTDAVVTGHRGQGERGDGTGRDSLARSH